MSLTIISQVCEEKYGAAGCMIKLGNIALDRADYDPKGEEGSGTCLLRLIELWPKVRIVSERTEV